MIEIIYLGTCSGTEPREGMHHCSWVMRIGGVNYWFDAGENCSYSAHLGGIDILATRALFVSHPHIDHIGGLANLLAVMRKLVHIGEGTVGDDNSLEVLFPDLEVFDAVKTVLCGMAKNRSLNFIINERAISDGVIFEDENIRVTALHNDHLKGREGFEPGHSFSFLIEAEGKRIVYSGDIKRPAELDGLKPEGADLLIIETGHNLVEDVLSYAASRKIKHLRFNHHGREILEDREGCEKKVRDFSKESGIDALICFDGMKETLS